MPNSCTLPIFPLPLTAFPGQGLALHIFEKRFKRMIEDCQAKESAGEPGRFAIFYTQRDRVAQVGTAMRIARVLKVYDDGRMDLIATGTCRCTTREWLDDAPYPIARLEAYKDTAPDWDEERATIAVGLHRRLQQIVSGQAQDDASYSGKSCLSFYLAPTSGLKCEDQQRLLAMPSENERLNLLVAHLEGMIARVESVHCAMNSIQNHLEMQRLLEEA